MLYEPLDCLTVTGSFDNDLLNSARYIRTILNGTDQYEGGLEELSKRNSQLLIETLKRVGIASSLHMGWVVFDYPDMNGNWYTRYWYTLAHSGKHRIYVDISASRLNEYLMYAAGDVLILPIKPYWFRSKRPSIRELAEISNNRNI